MFPDVPRGGKRPDIPPKASLVSPTKRVAPQLSAHSLAGRVLAPRGGEREKKRPKGRNTNQERDRACEQRSPLQWAPVPRWAPGGDGNPWRDSWRMGSRRLQQLHCDRPSSAPLPPPHLGASPAPRASEVPTVRDQAPPPDGGAGSI